MVVLMGIVSFAIDASMAYTERNRLHAAADAAAKSIAWERYRNNGANLQSYANREAVLGGFTAYPAGDTHVEVAVPPTWGRFAGNTDYAQVTMWRDMPTFFANVIGWSTLRPRAIAVAGQSVSQYCVITTAPIGSSPPGLTVGNSTLNMPNCAIGVTGGAEGTNPNSTVVSRGISIGEAACEGWCDSMGNVYPNSPAPVDPFAGRLPAPSHGSCGPAPATGVIPSGVCYSALTVAGTRTLAAGTTYFSGPITFNNNATLNGTGVTLVLDNGASLTGGQHNTISLTAPTSGTYNGVLIYQPATNSNPLQLQNNTTLNISGAIYMPAADVTVRNSFGTSSDCVLFVVRTLNIENGNGAMNNACSAYSGSPLMTVTLAE